MEANPQGWKKRREKASRRRHAKSPEDRAAIRAIRAAHASGEPVKPAAVPLEDMSREQLAEKYAEAFGKVPPRIKDSTLIERLKEQGDE